MCLCVLFGTINTNFKRLAWNPILCCCCCAVVRNPCQDKTTPNWINWKEQKTRNMKNRFIYIWNPNTDKGTRDIDKCSQNTINILTFLVCLRLFFCCGYSIIPFILYRFSLHEQWPPPSVHCIWVRFQNTIWWKMMTDEMSTFSLSPSLSMFFWQIFTNWM